MKMWARLLFFFGLLAGLAWLFVPSNHQTEVTPPLSVKFLKTGLLQIRQTEHVKTIKLLNKNNRLISITNPYHRSSVEIEFPWKPGEVYHIIPSEGHPLTIKAPDQKQDFVIRIHAPTGQKPHEFFFTKNHGSKKITAIPLPVLPNQTIDVMVEIEKLSDENDLVVDLESQNSDKKNLTIQNEWAEKNITLQYEFDKRFWTSSLKIGTAIPQKPLLFAFKNGDRNTVLPFEIQFISQNLNENDIIVDNWRLPTNKTGTFSSRQLPDQIIMPNLVWNRIASWFQIRPTAVSFYKPYTFHSTPITNTTQYPLSLLIQCEVVNPDTHQPVPYFDAPDPRFTGNSNKISGFVQISPGKTVTAVLPLFVTPDTKSGSYKRVLTITLLGTRKVLKRIEKPLYVITSKHFYTFWILFITALSLFWLVLFLFSYKKLVKSLGVKVLVLLSLLGSLQFCLSFISGIVSSISYALLGPFNCLVGGLFSEVMLYLIITSILYLVPRVGALTISSLISYIMGGIMFGSFGVTDILFTGSSIAFGEIFLLLFGVTRFKPDHSNSIRLIPLMLALGLSDAASTYSSLILNSVFYRLFFADWYFILQVGITGFFYTLIGVYLGKSLGKSLRKVQV